MDNRIQFEKATFWYSEGILYCKLFNQDINYNLTEENTLNYINVMLKEPIQLMQQSYYLIQKL